MIDRQWIGHELPPSVLPIERTRLVFFAKAIGETDPVYTDTEAARAAGYADLPAPPTFLFAAELDSGATDRLLDQLQIPLAKLLHGEQSFDYHAPVCAGDTVTVQSRITDIYDKKNGALEFVVKSSVATNQRGERVAELRTVIVCKH
ncbi:MaoC family dehydratase N-terminal domain-containing protein [Variovorax sp. KK3]|uniref:MaoC family dehydratase N-terminal domain-containing protein n=1 Tax=Variovorax sp. KK3 TaxID=1855728 RepID=UPI00097BB131|nr:MaoC family dehydratase N-terminal domain-containing protein [Variovorax sp. KK3]